MRIFQTILLCQDSTDLIENGNFEKAKKRKGFFKEGRLTGDFETYDQEGRLVNKMTYRNGQVIG